MEEANFWTNLVTSAGAESTCLDDLSIPMTNEVQQTNEMSSEVQEVDSLTPSQAAPPSRPTRPNQKRAKNFDQDEDLAVCNAWLMVSKDPIHGANQQRSTFWGKVRAHFDKHKKTSIVRSESSIMHRWLTIQTQVNKFSSYYEQIVGRNQSGVTIQDMVLFNFIFVY